jgi:hypothetical protein
MQDKTKRKKTMSEAAKKLMAEREKGYLILVKKGNGFIAEDSGDLFPKMAAEQRIRFIVKTLVDGDEAIKVFRAEQREFKINVEITQKPKEE